MMLAASCSEELKPTPYAFTDQLTGENNKTWRIRLIEQTLNEEISCEEFAILPC